jgi:peptide deformylase
MPNPLKIIFYPDPRLRKVSKPIKEFTPELALLAAQMLELMRASKGVGLAAPQVGKNIRLFVMNATNQPGDDRVIINPTLTEPEGEETAEEGCLSIPDVKIDVARSKTLHLSAQDINGKPFEETQTGYVARVWQHEYDHLNGILLTDRMGALAKVSFRRRLKELEDEYEKQHPVVEKKKRSR